MTTTSQARRPDQPGADRHPRKAHRDRHRTKRGLWRRLGVASLVASALVSTSLAVAPSAGAVSACTTTVNLSALQSTITAATAGDVICVNAGTFTPASSTPTIRITKSLTLRGAQAGVTPVAGGRSGGESQLHAYQNNAIMSVEASNVEIDGFEFDDYSYGISVPGGHGGRSNITIKNNWMHADQTSGQYAGMNGHFRSVALNVNTGGSVTTDPLTGVTVTNNLMYANTPWYNTQGALIGHSGGSTTTNFTITNNVMTALPRSGGSNRSIAHGGGPGSYLINNFTMTGNTIAAGTMNFGNVDNGTVTGNTFGDAATTNYAGGYIGLINSTVSGNTFQGGAYFSLWGTQYGFTRPSADVDIENNSFTFASNNFLGLAEPSVDVATIAIRNNKFNAPSAAKNCATAGSETNATIVGAASTGNLVAERNYWGAGSGPGDVFCGFNSIDTTPWMASYTDDATKAGQPGFWPLDVVEGFPVGAPVPTSTGSDVAQSFYSGTSEAGSITFGTVATAGTTTVSTVTNTDPTYVAPNGFTLGTSPTYYEVATTASFTGDLTICLSYNAADYPTGTNPQILHYTGGAWADVTSSVDTTNHIVCGLTDSLSPFALGTGAITVNAVTDTRDYDATTDSADVPTLDGSTPLVAGNTLEDCTQSFDTKNAGTNKTITATGCVVKNAAGTDVTSSYVITYADDNTGTINAAALTINAVTDTKTYNGTTASSGTPTVSGLQTGDTVTGLTQSFDSAAAGSRTLSVDAGYTVDDGNSGSNYTVTENTAGGTINPASGVSATVTVPNKTYNDTTGATITGCSLTGVNGDVNCGYGSATATFADANAGTAKTVNISGLTLTGTDAGNYSFDGTATSSADIDQAALTINAVTDTKTYNGTTASSGTPTVSGLQGNDTVTGKAQVFDSANAGSRTLSVSAYLVNDGNDGDNYTVTENTAGGTINPASGVSATVTVADKTYNDATGATITGCSLTGVNGDVNCGYGSATATFANANAGTAKTVNISGLTLTGTDAGNYSFDGTATSSADIDQAALTIDAVTDTKTYNATTASSGTPTVSGLQGNDTVTGKAQVFDSANAGSRTLSVSAYLVNDGNSGLNYTVTTNPANGTINQAALTINAVTSTKTYNGTTASSGTPTVSGLQGSDTVTGRTQVFNSANASTTGGRTLTVTAYTVNDGNSGGNYTVTTNTANGTINKAALTINAVTDTKAYDGTTASSGTPTVSGLQGSDTVTGRTQVFNSPNIGTRTLTVSGYTVNDGNSGGNYNVTTTTATGTITAIGQTITVTTPAPASAGYYSTFTVAATGGASGNPVVITSSGGCAGGGSGSATILMTSGTSTCTVKYNQAASTNYAAAPQVTNTTTATKATTITTAQLAVPSPSTAGTSVRVYWSVAATNPAAGAPSGTVTVTSALSNGASCSAATTVGYCSITLIKAGSDTLTITYNGSSNFAVSSTTLAQTVNPGTLSTLTLSPATATVTANTPQTYTVTGADRYGNVSGASLTSTTSFSITNGTCALNVCRSTKAGAQTVTATSGSLRGTATLNITAGVPTAIAFGTQPYKAKVNTALSPAPTVRIVDQWGNTVTTSTALVTVKLGSNPTGATLSGTLAVNAVNGVATFTNLKIDKVGKDYTLQAASPNFTSPTLSGATSNKFEVKSSDR